MSANQANTSGQVTLRRDVKFNGVKVFSATMVADRDQLGEKVTAWMAGNPQLKVTDIVITQSSDEAFHCIAITDPGTRMVEMATADKFRHIFLNPPDIGGRYSALSYFGLVPAALMGLDLKRLLTRAEDMVRSCAAEVPVAENPGVLLGAIMGECAKAGRNKLTIATDTKVAALGLWIEQLVAESTGKEGQGILPVQGEPLGALEVYGSDRLFVSIGSEQTAELEVLANAGHPIVSRTLTDNYDLGSEFFVWEFATAVAGWRLGINPFDQPNVQESKDATKALLEKYKQAGKLPEQLALASDGQIKVYGREPEDASSSLSVPEALQMHCAKIKPGDYVALLTYVEETPEVESAIQEIRAIHPAGVLINRDVANHRIGDDGQVPGRQCIRQ